MKIESTKKVYDGKWLNMFVTSFEKDGKTLDWEFASRNKDINNKKCDAVIIIPVLNDKLVMIKEFRIPIQDYEYGFPAGLVEEEGLEETISRELKEETGLSIKEIVRISPFIYSSCGLTDECCTLAYVYCEGEISRDFLHPSEDIETLVMDFEEMCKLFNSNVKFGAKAWVNLLMFYKQGNFKL